ncbi:MAG: WD40 repeat domain-containing serine/threonine protein kinase [Myxococcales bacterium]
MGTQTTNKLKQLAELAVQLRLATTEQIAEALKACSKGLAEDPAEWLERQGVISASERALLEQRAGVGVEHATMIDSEPSTKPGRLSGTSTLKMRTARPLPVAPSEPAPAEQESGADTLAIEHSGRYVIRHLHASGGQARILLAYDEHIGREVALKEVALDETGTARTGRPGASMTSVEMQRLLREARVTGQLEHPNIVPVYDLGRRKDGALYYTMRFVRGVTLSQRLAACKTLRERLRLLRPFLDICSAIAYAHSRGVIHRDIKPANAMVGEFGETVLLDWGIAKVSGKQEIRGIDIESEARLLREDALAETMAGSAIGTPGYMSPEQALGKIEEIDERSDVYGLGALLYQLLTGQPPHTGKTEAIVLMNASRGVVKPVKKVCPEAPPELAAVAEKALQREKSKRYQSAKDLADEIESYMTGGRVSAYHYSSWELFHRFARQHKRAMAVAGLVLAVIIGALVAVTVSLTRERAARQEMEVAREQEHRERLAANYHLAAAYVEKADRLKEDFCLLSAAGYAAQSLLHNPVHPRSPFYTEEFAASTPEGRALRVRAASTIYQTELHRLTDLLHTFTADEVLTRPAFSPNGEHVAVGSWDNKVRVWNLETRKLEALLKGHEGRVEAVAYSPDGKLLASASNDQRVILWNTATGERRFVLRGHTKPVRAVAFSPDGKLLASCGWDGAIILWDVASGRQQTVLRGHAAEVDDIAFSPDGLLLASAGADKTVRLWDVASGKQRSVVARFASAVESIAFAPDGSKIAAACKNEQAVRLFETAAGDPVRVFEGHHNGVVDVAWSPDGEILLTGSWDTQVRLWGAKVGKPLVTLENHDDFVTGVTFNPAGDAFATASYDRTLKVWRLRKESGLATLAGHTDLIYGLAFSPDGSLLASGSWDKTVKIWDVARRRLLFTLKGHASRVDRLAFSPDSTRLATISKDRTVRLWDVRKGALLLTIQAGDAELQGVDFSADGKLIATAGTDNAVRLWDAASGKRLGELRGHKSPVNDVAFSPDGTRLASAGMDSEVLIWDLRTRKLLKVLSGHTDWAWDVGWSPDGRQIISTGKDGQIILWDAASGALVRRFIGHRQWVDSAQVSPNGRLLASGSDDRTARIWDTATGEQLLMISSTLEVVAVAISPNGSTLAIGDANVVALYPMEFSALDADPKTLLERAKAEGFMPQELSVRQATDR